MTGNQALRSAIDRLRRAGIDDPARDARALLAFAIGVAADRLTMHQGDPMTDLAMTRFDKAIAAREMRQPVSQIIGQRMFWGHLFKVTPDVLDPRPETELLVHLALQRPFVRLLDLGTGSGCVLLSCLAGMPVAQGLGTDISAQAIAVATINANALGLSTRAAFQVADWCDGVAGLFDLILSNPPYIAAAEMADLAADVRDWEPHLALTPGGDGLNAYRIITRQAPARLWPGGRIGVEIGPSQGAAVARMCAAAGLADVQIFPDFDGRDRVVMAVKPG